jgi:hypothetical protein
MASDGLLGMHCETPFHRQLLAASVAQSVQIGSTWIDRKTFCGFETTHLMP